MDVESRLLSKISKPKSMSLCEELGNLHVVLVIVGSGSREARTLAKRHQAISAYRMTEQAIRRFYQLPSIQVPVCLDSMP